MERHSIENVFDKAPPLQFHLGTLQMKIIVKKTSSSCHHGAKMRQTTWRSGLKAAGNVEALF